ncbi:MAG: hypothetical protein KIH10_03710 [Candidatus Freyarchaeota archaeon]|nr:hypothetical protein [Candidatus Jordarchaeia archaeon]MBS7280502.1 hypothetical protein [Candidatus Jordarchaeia archaeon]
MGRRYMVVECPSCNQYFAATLSAKPSCPRCGKKFKASDLKEDIVSSWKAAAKIVQKRQAEKTGGKYNPEGMCTKTEKFEEIVQSLGREKRVPLPVILEKAEKRGLSGEWVLKRLEYLEREGMLVRRGGYVEFT